MDDLDDVRQWMGYEQIDILATSYGTKAAQVYLRQHPDRVRTMVLRGVLPVNVPFQFEFAKHAQRTLDRVFQLCQQQPHCKAAFPDVHGEFDELLRRTSKAPIAIRIQDPSGRDMPLTDRALRAFVNESLSNANQAAALPLLIHLAFQQQYNLLTEILEPGPESYGGRQPPMPTGIFLSLICTEATPKISLELERATSRGTFLGDFPVRQQVRTCEGWPKGELPKNFWAPVKSSVPVLLLSGDLDPVTPPENAAIVAKTLSNSRQLLMPNRSHADIDPCINRVAQQVLISGDLRAVDTSCLEQSHPLNFPVDQVALRDALKER
jgi:pimeloyl-ACP methyl ester carboxylesterase